MAVPLWFHLMKLLLGRIFRVSIKYVYQRGNTYYYQRKIPQDLLPRYPGTTHIKVNLKTNEPVQVAKKVRDLNRGYESTWAAMRGNPDLQPLSIRKAAIKLLDQYGLKPQPAHNDESHRVLRRLQVLREWSHEQEQQVFPRST